MIEEKDLFEVTVSDESFKKWIEKDFISEEIKQALNKASILILPTIGFRTENDISFPIDTTSVYQYFNSKLPSNISIEVCIDDANYQELSLNSDYKRIGIFLLNSVVLSVSLNVLSSYIYDKYVKEDDTKPHIEIRNEVPTKKEEKKTAPKKYMEKTRVKFTVIVVDTTKGQSKTYNYEGPAKDAKEITNQIKELWKNEN